MYEIKCEVCEKVLGTSDKENTKGYRCEEHQDYIYKNGEFVDPNAQPEE